MTSLQALLSFAPTAEVPIASNVKQVMVGSANRDKEGEKECESVASRV